MDNDVKVYLHVHEPKNCIITDTTNQRNSQDNDCFFRINTHPSNYVQEVHKINYNKHAAWDSN